MPQNNPTASQPSLAGASGQQSSVSGSSKPLRPKGLPLHKIYELPAPIRTFPLPSFYPNNPISIFHVLYAWTKQTFFPPPAEPFVVHEGIWSPESKSVNVIDDKSMRALWEQGFFGKGNLSRSEPNWLRREQVRRGLLPGQVSELVTANRREERRQMKWERAKSEQELIRQTRLREAQQASPDSVVNTRESSADATAPRFSVDAISRSKTEVAPASLDAKVDSTNTAIETASNVKKPSPIISHIEPKSGVDAATSVAEPALSTGTMGLVNGVDSDAKAAHDSLAGFNSVSVSAPTGPMEILRLPNSHMTLLSSTQQVPGAVSCHEPSSDRELEVLSTPGNLEAQVSAAAPERITSASVGDDQLPNGVTSAIISPVGPMELLALPNAHHPQVNGMSVVSVETSDRPDNCITVASTAAAHKLTTIHEDFCYEDVAEGTNGNLSSHLVNDAKDEGFFNGTHSNGTAKPIAATATATDSPQTPKPIKRRKSVRFSPKVESATYQLSDPPSPSFALLNGKSNSPPNGTALGPSVLDGEEQSSKTLTGAANTDDDAPSAPTEVVNKEHLQLTAEEAFFLSFGLGALRVIHPTTKVAIPTPELFRLFRQNSYFPSRATDELQPDDGFLVNYAVYHHFRSLGWVPRAGIKFGVDWLLYAKGPVFDHAEFGAIILPSYSHQWWKDSDRKLPRKTWHWLHGVVRVLSHVQKSLVLVYVDVPPPPVFDEAMKQGGPADVFKLYSIREVMVKRWSSNRNR